MSRREFITEAIDESKQADVIRTIVGFLASKGVTSVKATYGFIVQRDLRGDKQGQDAVVPLADTQQLIERGLREGTIEWSGSSNFQLTPLAWILN